MAIFKPEVKNGGTNKFLGTCEFGIVNFKDRTDEFDWADLYIEVEIQQKFSEYTRKLQIKGSFEKDGNELITGGSVLKRLYHFFDTIGCAAGLNIKGTWEDENGEVIDNIQSYLSKNFIKPAAPGEYEPSYDYIGYIYKAQPKKPGDKAWINVYPKIYTNSSENKAKLQNDVDWLKGKGIIKELTDEVINKPAMSGSGLSNL